MSTLTFTNVQTAQSIKVSVDNDHKLIVASALKKLDLLSENPLSENEQDTVPCMFYDPGFVNTIVCKSKISDIDQACGAMCYRGYDIKDLMANSNFTEVAYLLINGELPSQSQYDSWNSQILRHTYVHKELESLLETFRYDSHPMGMLIAAIAALSTFHSEANPALVGENLYISGPREQHLHQFKTGSYAEPPSALQICHLVRNKQIVRILGKVPTFAAHVYRHREGRSFNHPSIHARSITEQFLYMLDKLNEDGYQPDPVLVEIVDKAFILLAESGSSCSTITMRHLISSGVDPYSAISGACGALFGERKAGEVANMFTDEIQSIERIDAFLEQVKQPRPKSTSNSNLKLPRKRLIGFGHRIYKMEDDRVHLMKGLALRCYKHLHGKDPYAPSRHPVYLALQLEERVKADKYFVDRNLHANVEYWTGVLLYTLEFPSDMFPVFIAIPRVVGYIAHAFESMDDAEFKIFRPRQIYIGTTLNSYKSEAERDLPSTQDRDLAATSEKSNPAAQLRRSLIEDVKNAAQPIEQTRSSIKTLGGNIAALLGQVGDRDLSHLESEISQLLRHVRKSLTNIEQESADAAMEPPATSPKQGTFQTELQELERQLEKLQHALKPQ